MIGNDARRRRRRVSSQPQGTIDRVLKLIRDFRDNPREGIVTLLLTAAITSAGVTLTIVGTQGGTALFAVVMERFQFQMIRSEIESFRQDYEQTPCSDRIMLRQAASTWNQRIEHEHESNKHNYSDWASTDRWNEVKRIDVQCGAGLEVSRR
jgi:hypothetical protein